jgi:hypothetical protein
LHRFLQSLKAFLIDGCDPSFQDSKNQLGFIAKMIVDTGQIGFSALDNVPNTGVVDAFVGEKEFG